VATLLILQARGRVTASELADELEVSERTARRDLEALAMAGIPVYSQAGRNGGWSLVGGARTDLSGLTAAEARTLFLVAGPSSAVTPEAKTALRKLVHALPETFRAEAEAAASAVVLDPARWGSTTAPRPPYLDVLQQAVVAGVQVRLGYADRERKVSERTVHPLGLVAKSSVWYLVADTDAGLRTFRVGRVRSVVRTDDPVVRPEGFDLAVAWQDVVTAMDERRNAARAIVHADAQAVGWLRGRFGAQVEVGETVDDGRVEVEIGGWSPEALAYELVSFGGHVEVVRPPEVRAHMARLGAELVGRYGT
jgi:predicted DNA-binding transcriptional regulator YafY